MATPTHVHAGPGAAVRWRAVLVSLGALLLIAATLAPHPQVQQRPVKADWGLLSALLEGFVIVDSYQMTASTGWIVAQDAGGQHSVVYRVRWLADEWELRQELVVQEPLSAITMDEAGIVYAWGDDSVLYLRERTGWMRQN